ncbi:hypothetical protein E2C01_099819 [Portunus trituberculatus]|uniref:Uncharacterized protein n=1 Tax=Portunus trituberculatus TaxID=210409 RepID=A0A5B7KBD6_PORTR|nr:hypothetical protein [Portunus trituberculatus]
MKEIEVEERITARKEEGRDEEELKAARGNTSQCLQNVNEKENSSCSEKEITSWRSSSVRSFAARKPGATEE